MAPRPAGDIDEAGRGGVAVDPTATVKSQKAPCGKIVVGVTYEDREEQTILTEEHRYSCGCLVIRHQYHDGSVSRKEVQHNGKILVDDLLFAE